MSNLAFRRAIKKRACSLSWNTRCTHRVALCPSGVAPLAEIRDCSQSTTFKGSKLNSTLFPAIFPVFHFIEKPRAFENLANLHEKINGQVVASLSELFSPFFTANMFERLARQEKEEVVQEEQKDVFQEAAEKALMQADCDAAASDPASGQVTSSAEVNGSGDVEMKEED